MLPSARSTGSTSRMAPLAVILVAIAALALPIAATAAPPPEPFCGICGSDLEGAIGAGTLDVRVDESGDSEWIARVPVDEAAADEYRADPAALETAVDDAWAGYDAPRRDIRDRDLAVEAGDGDPAVVVRFAVEGVARPGVGDAWLLGYFYAGGTQTRYDVAAERVTIHVPEGHEVTNSPANAAVDGDTDTWTREGGDPSRTAYVTYGPAGETVGNALESRATVTAAYGPLVLEHGLYAGVLPAAVLGVGAAVVAHLGRDRGFFGVDSWLGRRLSATGVAVLDRFAALPGLGSSRSFGRRSLYALAGAVAAGAALVGLVSAGVATAVFKGAFALAACLFLPLGYAIERGSVPWPVTAALVGTPFAAAAAVGPYYGSWDRILLLGAILVPFSALALAVGYPLSLVGRRLGHTGSPAEV